MDFHLLTYFVATSLLLVGVVLGALLEAFLQAKHRAARDLEFELCLTMAWELFPPDKEMIVTTPGDQWYKVGWNLTKQALVYAQISAEEAQHESHAIPEPE